MALGGKEFIAPKKEPLDVELDRKTSGPLGRFCGSVMCSPVCVVENLVRRGGAGFRCPDEDPAPGSRRSGPRREARPDKTAPSGRMHG